MNTNHMDSNQMQEQERDQKIGGRTNVGTLFLCLVRLHVNDVILP